MWLTSKATIQGNVLGGGNRSLHSHWDTFATPCRCAVCWDSKEQSVVVMGERIPKEHFTWNKAALNGIFISPPPVMKLWWSGLSCENKRTAQIIIIIPRSFHTKSHMSCCHLLSTINHWTTDTWWNIYSFFLTWVQDLKKKKKNSSFFNLISTWHLHVCWPHSQKAPSVPFKTHRPGNIFPYVLSCALWCVNMH